MNQTTESLEVQCDEGFDGGLAPIYVMELYDVLNKRLLINSTSKIPWFKVEGLQSGFSFHILLYATNIKGRSDLFPVNTNTLQTERHVDSLHLQLGEILYHIKLII